MSLTQNIARAKTDYDEVYEAGRVHFMEQFQDYGERGNYAYAFVGWTDDMPSPAYDIVCDTTMYAAYAMLSKTKITDMVKWLGDKKLDVSRAATIQELCSGGQTSTFPPLDMSGVKTATHAFYNMPNLKELMLLNVREDCVWNRTFHYTCFNKFTLTGTIGKGGFDLSFSKYLDKASIINIFEHLSTTASELTVIISKTAVNNAFETSAGTADGSNSAEWQALIATRTNWSILLQDN